MSTNIHGTALLVGTIGVLIRGPSGSGKSTLARQLLRRHSDRGLFAGLVADDRVDLRACHDRLVASAPPTLSGLVEVRGLGIVAVAPVPAAVIRLVADLVDEPDMPRMPEASECEVEIAGVILPRLAVASLSDAGLDQMLAAIDRLAAGRQITRQ